MKLDQCGVVMSGIGNSALPPKGGRREEEKLGREGSRRGEIKEGRWKGRKEEDEEGGKEREGEGEAPHWRQGFYNSWGISLVPPQWAEERIIFISIKTENQLAFSAKGIQWLWPGLSTAWNRTDEWGASCHAQVSQHFPVIRTGYFSGRIIISPSQSLKEA